MGLLKFTFLKQFATKSSLKHLKQSYFQQKSHINLPLVFTTTSRSYTQYSPQDDISLHFKAVEYVASSPNTSVIPFIEDYQKGKIVKHNELKIIIDTLCQKKLFDRALEVSEWMTSRGPGHPISKDLAVRLYLTGQVHGVEAAERFFKEIDDHSVRMYDTLLNCYIKANLLDKTLSHFKIMKGKGFVRTASAYNNIMSLCMRAKQAEKVPKLLMEMQENGVSPDRTSFTICLKSLALKSDTNSMENLVKIMESEPRFSMDWSTCSFLGSYFSDKGCKEKALHYLQMAEHRIGESPVGLKHLITTYAKLGDTTKVLSLWQKHKAKCKAQINDDYITMIRSLVKMDKFEEAEGIFREWDSSGNLYDSQVPNTLLLGYTQKGLIKRAERILEHIINKVKTPAPNTWSIISAGHFKCGDKKKALECMKKALELWPEHQGWVPKREAISSILKWFGDDGELTELDQFLELLNRVVPMNQEMYHALLRANLRHGNEVGDILKKMKADNIDVDEETSKLIKLLVD